MFSDDSEVEDITFRINEHYAKAYEYRKEREELAKLREKYGSDVDEDDDEEDSEDLESEDEDGEELTPAMDAAILRTLARIKRKDPSIYETGKDVFEEEKQRTGELQIDKRAKDRSKPLTIRQHALASAIQDATGSRSPSPEPLTHVEEQKKLREETIAAFHAAADGLDDEDDLLVPREKTKDDIEREEEEYRAFLEREVGQDLAKIITVDDDVGQADGVDVKEEEADEPKKKRRKREKANPESGKGKQDQDQEFLVNYILNRGWIDKSARRLPTYKEITGKGNRRTNSDSEDGASGSEAGKNGSLEEDEFEDIADAFESSYNFRFEEPGAAEIARHPRNLPSLVRRQDTSRKEAREKRKARKEEELLKKKEEVKRLKALKMKELRAKLERIGAEGGKRLDESRALQELDLEADWDPEAHDRQMRELYANDATEFGPDDVIDEEKPTWDDDIDITDIVPHGLDTDDEGAAPSEKKKKKKKKKRGGDEDAMDADGVDVDEMDADVERPKPAFDDEDWDGTEEMRKRKLEEYMDEVYGLDFNDMVGGMPTRFHYTKTEPQHFGLTPAEILMATDAELNSYMGIKKYAPYRKEGKGRNWDAQRGARLRELKEKLKERGTGGVQAVEQAMKKAKKRMGKKERMREKAAATAAADDGGTGEDEDVKTNDRVPKERTREREATEVDSQEDAWDQRNDAAEASTKRKRQRHRKAAAKGSA
ncbi:KRI1-like family C-terminal-domain-containing protein, partial [Dichomitus squalens]